MAKEIITIEELEKIRKGDIKAFERMLFIFEKPIFGYIKKMVGNNGDAEDLVQEVFIKVFKNRKVIDPEAGFKSWLYKIATNTVYDWWRKRKTRPETVPLEDYTELPETFSQDESYNIVEDIERQEDIEKALERLKPNSKTVILLYYFREFTYEEIAKILNLPLNTIKTHLYRAKKELKEILQKNYG